MYVFRRLVGLGQLIVRGGDWRWMLYWSAPLDLVLCCRPNRENMLFDSGELGQVRGLVVSTSGSYRYYSAEAILWNALSPTLKR